MKGRTYRYFDDALFPFGYGLSYTQFETGDPTIVESSDQNSALTINVPVKNVGQRDGTETLQLYIYNPQDPYGPLKSLRAFKRIDVKAGQTVNAKLQLEPKSFEFWDDETNTMRVKPGEYEILVGTSSDDQDLDGLTISLGEVHE